MDGTLRSLLLRDTGVRFRVSTLLAGSIGFLLAIGIFLFVRRVTGAMTAPLPAPQLVATAAGLCVWAIIVRELAPPRRVYFWLPLCALLLFAIGSSYPANRLVDWLIWLPAIGLISGSRLARRRKKHFPARFSSEVRVDGEISERILQQLMRVRTADGKDVLRGMLSAEFMAGERQTTVCVGFCPPFELLPQVDVNVTGDYEADIKLAQVLYNGAQLDVRLSEPAEEPVAVTIDFFAIEPGGLSDDP